MLKYTKTPQIQQSHSPQTKKYKTPLKIQVNFITRRKTRNVTSVPFMNVNKVKVDME